MRYNCFKPIHKIIMLCIIYKESLTNGYRIHTYIIHAVEPPKIMYIILMS